MKVDTSLSLSYDYCVRRRVIVANSLLRLHDERVLLVAVPLLDEFRELLVPVIDLFLPLLLILLEDGEVRLEFRHVILDRLVERLDDEVDKSELALRGVDRVPVAKVRDLEAHLAFAIALMVGVRIFFFRNKIKKK